MSDFNHLFLHALELEPRLLNSFAHLVGRGGASDSEGVGRRGGLAGSDTFHFADRLLTGGFAVVAVHALDGIDDSVGTNTSSIPAMRKPNNR